MDEAFATLERRLPLPNSLLELKVAAEAGCVLCVFLEKNVWVASC